MNDNPVDSKASALNKMDPMHNGKPGVQQEDFEQFSSPMNQGVKEENAVMKSRKKNIDSHQATYDAFDKKAKSFKPTSQAQVDAINSKYTDLAAKVNKRVSRANKSADSINSVRKSKKSANSQDFNKLMEAGPIKPSGSPMNQGTKIADKIAAGKAKADAKKKKSPLNNKENRAEVKAAKEGKSGKEKRQAAREVRKQQRKEGKRGVKKTIKQVEKTVAKVKDSKVYKVGKGIADTVSNVKKGKIGAAIKSGKQTIADAKKKKSDSPATMKKHKY